MAKYSFVIPVYNSQKYIDECLASIMNQSFRDYEILLIDDGSNDNSGAICDNYSRKYENIRTIHIRNSGAAVARNTGMEEAKGEFIIFLDSDDYWALPDGLERINKLITSEVDVLVFASCDYYEETRRLIPDRYDYPQVLNDMDSESCLLYMIGHDLFNTHACKKVHRKGFLDDNGLRFRPGIRTEDVELEIRVANCMPRYKFFNEKLYVYRQRDNSVTKTIDLKHLTEFADLIKEFAVYPYCTEAIREAMLSYDAYQFSLLLAHMGKLSRKDRKNLLSDMREYGRLYQFTIYPRTKKIALLYRSFGLTVTQMALSAYLTRKSGA